MSEIQPTRPILRYHGGKWVLAPWIIEHFPDHRVYVEPFGGAASVLVQKQRSYAEVYNDLDGEIVNLFRVVRDNGSELKRLLALTPFAREEYKLAWTTTDDHLEQARRTVIRSFMGFGSSAATGKCVTGFRANSNRSGTTPAHDWHHYAGTGFRTYTGDNRATLPCADWVTFDSALDPLIERLRGVVIENRDALQIITAHDGANTLHYIDPPYVQTTRDKGSDYRFEMTDEQHRQLSECLHAVQGMVIISGYHSSLYDELYGDWSVTTRDALADGARPRTEVLWMNDAVAMRQAQLTLQDAITEAREVLCGSSNSQETFPEKSPRETR